MAEGTARGKGQCSGGGGGCGAALPRNVAAATEALGEVEALGEADVVRKMVHTTLKTLAQTGGKHRERSAGLKWGLRPRWVLRVRSRHGHLQERRG